MDDLPKLKVLTVDDNRTNLQILQVFLKKLGHEAIAAEDGAQALAKYEEHHPDLVLMDIMMPVMDGLEATRRFGRYRPIAGFPSSFCRRWTGTRISSVALRRG